MEKPRPILTESDVDRVLAEHGQNFVQGSLPVFQTLLPAPISTSTPIDPAGLPISNDIIERILKGYRGDYYSRSEEDAAVITALINTGCDDDLIYRIFAQFPIGQKYREKGRNGIKYLDTTIRKCREFVKANPKSQTSLAQQQAASLEFPRMIISGVAGEFARLYSSYLESPVHFFYMAFLTCMGSVVADRLTLASEICPQPRLYLLLLGESADDRKSTAIHKTVDFFLRALTEFAVCWGVGSAEGLQKKLEKDSTLLLCYDEFKQFISKCKIEASVLLPCVNTVFESNRYESRTKTTDIFLEKVYLSLLAASTIQTYERTWDSSFTDIGFNNRLFLLPGSGDRKHSIPAKIPEREIDHLMDSLQEVLRHVDSKRELSITPSAFALYDEWYNSLERTIHAKRLDVYAMRLMALLAVNDLKALVDDEVVRNVIALSNWQLEIRKRHDPIDADNQTARMEEKIRRVLIDGPRGTRELKQRTNANRMGLWFYEMAINNLSRSREIKWDPKAHTWRLV